MKGLVKLGAGGALVIALGIAVFLLLRGGGEKAKVEDLLRQAVADGAAGNADKCIAIIDPAYSGDGVSYGDVCNQVRQYIKPDAWKKAEIRSMDVGVDGDTASATLKLWLEGGGVREALGGVPMTLELNLRKTDGGWKVTRHLVRDR